MTNYSTDSSPSRLTGPLSFSAFIPAQFAPVATSVRSIGKMGGFVTNMRSAQCIKHAE